MTIFVVETPHSTWDVDAGVFELVDGALMFFDKEVSVAAFAKDQWTSVTAKGEDQTSEA